MDNLFKDLDFLDSKKFLNIKKDNSYIFDKLYIKYQKEYFIKKIYKNLSFKIKSKNREIFCPITLEIFDKEKNINFFGNPFSFISEKESDTNDEINSVFSHLIKKYEINNVIFKKKIEQNKIKEILNSEKEIIQKIILENKINLLLSIDDIIKDFSKGHKTAIKKNYEELEYNLINYKNYKKNQIFEMMELHRLVSNKITRSRETWLINEEMILSNKGFLINIYKDQQLISYSFFFHNQDEATYFSSCTIRENFKIYDNLTHNIIMKAIKYLKNINCKFLNLGVCETYYNINQNEFNAKLLGIERFKKSFGGIQNTYIIFNKKKF
jgi:hypothetical protein